MTDTERILQIRESERKSHIAMYSHPDKSGWLRMPVKTVMELLPLLENRAKLRILDLGCGIGRNCVPIAKYFQNNCSIDCVDILDFAIQTLNRISAEHGVTHIINGISSSIEEFEILQDRYHLILAVSSLEHVASRELFIRKLNEIRNGVVSNGLVCLIINSGVKEFQKSTGCCVPPQFEVNFTGDELEKELHHAFSGWDVIKSTQQPQCYEIPRDDGTHTLHTTVLTFVARKNHA